MEADGGRSWLCLLDTHNEFRFTVSVEFDFPTRPTKTTDSRSKRFAGESVEVDAIPAGALRAIARQCIEQHIDEALLDATKLVEAQERETLDNILSNLGEVTSARHPAQSGKSSFQMISPSWISGCCGVMRVEWQTD
jgi:hypothetical protein